MVIDPVQLILLVVILVLTVLLVLLGVQVYLLLKDVRVTITKANKVLDHVDSITENIDTPLTALSNFAMDAKSSSLLSVAKIIGSFIGRKKNRNS